MNRVDRLSAMLIHLQSKKIVTAKELAQRFDICIRTVYRDIRALEAAGIPIGSEADNPADCSYENNNVFNYFQPFMLLDCFINPFLPLEQDV